MSTKETFRALVLRSKGVPAKLEVLNRAELADVSVVPKFPGPCDLVVAVEYSNLNYKDALVVTGTYHRDIPLPMVGGIDLAGKVVDSRSVKFKVGDSVLVNGYGLGTDHYGGYAELVSIRSDWALKLPEGMSTYDAARLGTAGYTAMLCVDALQRNGVEPASGPVLVTGATGGVGSVATIILSQLGYHVVALTGKVSSSEAWLKNLGAKEVRPRADFETEPSQKLQDEEFAGCVDAAGNKILANVLNSMKFYGTVAACGLAGGLALETTMSPFILRGVTLAGVDSVSQRMEVRERVYDRFVPVLAAARDKMDMVSSGEGSVLGLGEVTETAARMLRGEIRGRYIVDLSKN